jgi:hypothetical protein
MSNQDIIYGNKVEYKLKKGEKPNYILRAAAEKRRQDIIERSPVPVTFRGDGDKKKFLKFLENEFTPTPTPKKKQKVAPKSTNKQD